MRVLPAIEEREFPVATKKEKIKINLGDFFLDHSRKILDLSPWGRKQLIVKGGTDFFLVSANCPHQGLPLNCATIKDNILNCRWHGCEFPLKPDSNGKRGNFLKFIILEVEIGFVELPD